MRILFVDDDPERFDIFDERMRGEYTLSWAKNAHEAKKLLDTEERYQIASLDHELGPSGYETGEDVVDHILKMPALKRPASVIVHSHYEDGAKRMQEALLRAGIPVGRKPFRK